MLIERNIMKKRFLSMILATSMAMTMMACQTKTADKPVNEVIEDSEDTESYSYNITALLSEDNTNNQVLLQGFTDALSDYLGEEHFTINSSSVTEEANSDDIANAAISSSPDMIFTAGKSTLLAAADATDTIPIVSTGIVDFKGTLRIASLNGKAWNKTTGRNITGISSKPSIVDQVSLMIESTKDLQTVGILFSPEDTDAIYQNEIFEAYLDQAGIPWKEYLIPASTESNTVIEEQNSTALSPSKFVAYSAKQGMDNTVESLSDDEEDFTGLNSTSSTRVAMISEFWTSGKVEHPSLDDDDEEDTESADEESTEETNEKQSSDSKSSDDDEEAVPTLSDLINTACNECSAIYIPYGSILTDQMETIGSIALNNNVVIIAGDTEIAKSGLVTLFYDPYSLGYAAGKKAVRVFNGDDISTIKIGYGDASDSVKLYNGKIAEKFDITFPKSFKELDEFLSTYEYGINTTRYSIVGD